MVKRNFTSEQLLDRYEDRREIKNLMVKFITADYMFRREYQMFDNYWSKGDDICLGTNEGWYTGREGVKSYFDGIVERTKLESELIKKAFPVLLDQKSDEELYGVGILNVKPLDTSIVEIAGDGATAKSIFAIRGSNTKLTTGGHVSYWEWAWVAVDWVWEDEAWKVWHMLYLQDLDIQDGTNWADKPNEFPEFEGFKPIKDFKFPEPTIKVTLRERYHTMRKFTPPPMYPKRYETFAETFSYGFQPGGN